MKSEELFEAAHINPKKDKDVAFLAINANQVLDSNTVPGLEVKTEELTDGVSIRVLVKKGTVIEKPVHMCFGMLHNKGVQRILMDFEMESDAKIDVVAHCVFPSGLAIKHIMDGKVKVGENSSYTYFERHIHGDTGGVEVYPKVRVELLKGAKFKTDFELVKGRVGLIDIDYETNCGESSVMEMTAKISGKEDDVIKIREVGHLNGKHSRGVLTSRIAVRGDSKAEVFNELTASAEGARGHVDCKEIIQDNATAKAIPIVDVRHPKAHVTHEAAIGSVDNKQLDTLMSRGLSEDDAVDLIIEGLLS